MSVWVSQRGQGFGEMKRDLGARGWEGKGEDKQRTGQLAQVHCPWAQEQLPEEAQPQFSGIVKSRMVDLKRSM